MTTTPETEHPGGTPPQGVVIGVDGSQVSGAALAWAAREAAKRGESLTILFALHTPLISVPFSGSSYVPPTSEMEEQAQRVLDLAAAQVAADHPEVSVDTTLRVVPPAQALLEAARTASLVVVGTRGLGAVGSLFLGSVSSRVAARATSPVVVVPAESDAPEGGPVVVGVDGSAHADEALRFAFTEASRRGVDVVVVTAFQLPTAAVAFAWTGISEDATSALRDAAESAAADAIQRVRAEPGIADVPVEIRVVNASAADAIREAAEGAGLVVVGSRGWGEIRGMALGSVSNAVLTRASWPMAVLHAPTTTADMEASDS